MKVNKSCFDTVEPLCCLTFVSFVGESLTTYSSSLMDPPGPVPTWRSVMGLTLDSSWIGWKDDVAQAPWPRRLIDWLSYRQHLAVWTDRGAAEQGKMNHFLSTVKTSIYFLVPREHIENILDALASVLHSFWFSFFFFLQSSSVPLLFPPRFCPFLQSLSHIVAEPVEKSTKCCAFQLAFVCL